jgi:hypothetical protein
MVKRSRPASGFVDSNPYKSYTLAVRPAGARINRFHIFSTEKTLQYRRIINIDKMLSKGQLFVSL